MGPGDNVRAHDFAQALGSGHASVGGGFTGGYVATHHLLSLGRRRIAFFGDTDNPENAARYKGYLNV